jgi:hypothetical protein
MPNKTKSGWEYRPWIVESDHLWPPFFDSPLS